MLSIFRKFIQQQNAKTIQTEIVEKEVQDSSCQGSGGVPQPLESPKIGGFRGLITLWGKEYLLLREQP